MTVVGPYNNAVSSTPGLIDYWRLGESSGTTFANSVAGAPSATKTSNILNSGATLGVAGPLTLDSNTAVSFDGSNDDADAALNLSANSTLTLEFWLKWTSFSNNDDLAFEFTSNFNNTNGGFLVNPNSSTSSSRFEVALGRNSSRNSAYFTRPSANVWHHYAIVMNTARRRRAADPRLRRRRPRSRSSRAPAAPAPATSPTRPSTSCRATAARCSAPAASTRSRSTTRR